MVRAVWLTYDRGYDILKYYSDPDVATFAARHAIALLLASQCAAKDPPTLEKGEMDMDPSRGVARTIYSALDDFARQSHHPEISSAKLIVLGFSGIGALFGHFVQYAPDRVVAAILANPGQTEPWGMIGLDLSAGALAVPEFIVAGGADERAGTQRPFDYFTRHRSQDAPWVFVVQNGIPHCCVIDAKALILKWLGGIIKLRQPRADRSLLGVDTRAGWTGSILPCESSQRDEKGYPLWDICDAAVQRAGHPNPEGFLSAAWFPNRDLAMRWSNFVTQKQHPADSFPDGKDARHSAFAAH